MIVRVRFARGQPVQRRKGKNRHVALASAALLIPAALMAYVLGLWRLASDMGLAGEFGFSGVLSHWQLWIGIGAGLQFASHVLDRYARWGRMEMPPVLPMFHARRSADHPGKPKAPAR